MYKCQYTDIMQNDEVSSEWFDTVDEAIDYAYGVQNLEEYDMGIVGGIYVLDEEGNVYWDDSGELTIYE